MDIVIYASTNIFRIYLIYQFIQIFIKEEKPKKWKVNLIFGLFFLANTSLHIMFHTAWINIICNLVGIGLCVYLYAKNVKTLFFLTGAIYLINLGCDAVSTLPFVHYEDGRALNPIYSIIMVFLIFICELLTEKIMTYRENNIHFQSAFLTFIPICSIMIICSLIYITRSEEMEIAIISMGLLMINFFVFYLYNLLLKSVSQRYENEILKQRIEIYANQIDIILQSEDKVKIMRHDMKHHLNELKLLANRYEADLVKDYIDQMEDYIHNPNEIISSGNTEIDSVLNYMLQKAKNELITVNVNVILPEQFKHSFDVNIILGNLLENAIEAARETEEKILNVKINLKRGALKIEIENSYRGKLELVNSDNNKKSYLYKTSKKEVEQHGIGLESVEKIIEKYSGIIETEANGSRFNVKAILYIPKV